MAEIPWNPEMKQILGRPNFTCRAVATLLRKAHELYADVAERAEDEQAAVIHWTLSLYLKHGDDWDQHAMEEVRRMHAKLSLPAGGDASRDDG